MNKEDLIKFLKQNLTVIKSYGVTSLALFGLDLLREMKQKVVVMLIYW